MRPTPSSTSCPGTCAHFVVDTDGTIYQLVPLGVRCRHTVGLNWTAIGIEHVGTSDAAILDNPRQLHASLALTAWLMSRFRISLGDVIGHNESLTSPYHRELYAPWRCQTHGDWTRADMDRYRALLAAARPPRRCATRQAGRQGLLPLLSYEVTVKRCGPNAQWPALSVTVIRFSPTNEGPVTMTFRPFAGASWKPALAVRSLTAML